MFIYIIVLATTGKGIPGSQESLGATLILSQFVQKIWNFFRVPHARDNPLGYWLAATMYIFAYPFVYVWSAITLLEDTWESTTKKLSTPMKGYLFFALWVVAVVVALGRTTFDVLQW
jgi:hypothetical protein